MKFRLILIISTVASILLAGYFFNEWYKQKQENTRINNNFSALAIELKAENFNHNRLMDLTVKEIKNNFPELEEKLKKEFDIRLKNVRSISNTVTTVNHTFKTTVKDSTMLDTIQVQDIAFKDEWIDFEAQKINNDFYVNKNIVKVPLLQVIHKDKWKLKYLFKKRPLYQDIKSDNPYANIEFSRIIEVSK